MNRQHPVWLDTPFELVIRKIAANHLLSGIFDDWKTVPTVTVY